MRVSSRAASLLALLSRALRAQGPWGGAPLAWVAVLAMARARMLSRRIAPLPRAALVRASRRRHSPLRTCRQAETLDEDELRAIFDRFDANKDGMLDPDEFTLLLQQMMPSRANDFDEPHEPDGGATVPIKFNLAGGATMTLVLTEFKKAECAQPRCHRIQAPPCELRPPGC